MARKDNLENVMVEEDCKYLISHLPSRTVGGGGDEYKRRRKIIWVSTILGCSVPVVLPFCHILLFYVFWNSDFVVDRQTCSCSCWDTVFKGPYENGIAKYKHVYFNSTTNTLKMWVITVLFVILVYEAVKRVVTLAMKRRLRASMTLLLLSSVHSHYYSWWVYWNYWNDDFYSQWYHQLLFTCTEILSSVFVFMSLDKKSNVQPLWMMLVATVALFHIFCATWDQFLVNVLYLGGKMHQVMRDILLMLTDALQLAVVLYELRECAARKGTTLKHIVFQGSHLATSLLLFASMFFYILFCP